MSETNSPYPQAFAMRFTGGIQHLAHGGEADFGRIQNAIGTDELYAGILDLRLFFGKDGFLIPPETDGNIAIYIRDDTFTGKASNFQCQAIGRDIKY